MFKVRFIISLVQFSVFFADNELKKCKNKKKFCSIFILGRINPDNIYKFDTRQRRQYLRLVPCIVAGYRININTIIQYIQYCSIELSDTDTVILIYSSNK